MQVLFQDVRKIESDAVVIGFFEDERPLKGLAGELDWLLCGALSSLLLENRLRGALGDAALLSSRGKIAAQKIFLLGLGPRTGYSLSSLRSAARAVATNVLGAGAASAALEYLGPAGASFEEGVPALREGLSEGAAGRSLAVSLIAPDAEAYERLCRLVNL